MTDKEAGHNKDIVEKSRQIILLGFGLSFIYPYYWWTLLYVPAFSLKGLYEPTVPGFIFIMGFVAAAVILLRFERKVVNLLSRYPWVVPAVVCLSVAATVALALIYRPLLSTTAGLAAWQSEPLLELLAAIGNIGIVVLLVAYGKVAIDLKLAFRDYALAICGSLFLFFGYVLLFVSSMETRFLLCSGLIGSAVIWIPLWKKASAYTAASGTAVPSRKAESQNEKTAERDTSFQRASFWDWLPSIVSYIALSVVYWLLFTSDSAGAFPEDAFSTFGASPIGAGEAFLYALFLLYLIIVLIGLLVCKPHQYRSFFLIIQGVNTVFTLISLFSLVYFVPHAADLAEGLNCLIRANVQALLLVIIFFIAMTRKRPSMMLYLMLLDAVLLLSSLGFVAAFPSSLSAVVQWLPIIGFICGALVSLCFVYLEVANIHEKKANQESQDSFNYLLDVATREYGLSEREREVFALIARGYGAKGVAQTLNIATSTASTHISRIYTKLDVHSKLELLQFVDELQKSAENHMHEVAER